MYPSYFNSIARYNELINHKEIIIREKELIVSIYIYAYFEIEISPSLAQLVER